MSRIHGYASTNGHFWLLDDIPRDRPDRPLCPGNRTLEFGCLLSRCICPLRARKRSFADVSANVCF